MLSQLQHESRTAILYEAPHKLCRTIADLRAICGDDRVVSFCRELTKVHEEVLRMSLSEADSYYAEHAPRGEFVLVLDGAVQEDAPLTAQDALTLAQMYLSQGMSAAAAAKMAAKETGLTKNEVYRMLHQED